MKYHAPEDKGNNQKWNGRKIHVVICQHLANALNLYQRQALMFITVTVSIRVLLLFCKIQALQAFYVTSR